MKRLRCGFGTVLILAILGNSEVGGQGRAEVRGDAIFTKKTALYVGAGVLFPVGTYIRSGIIGAAGIVDGGSTFRADLISLFHADPFRESKWGPYGGGGISFRRDSKTPRMDALLLAILGVEGPPRRGFSTGFEVGLGGGVRAAIVLRRTEPHTR